MAKISQVACHHVELYSLEVPIKDTQTAALNSYLQDLIKDFKKTLGMHLNLPRILTLFDDWNVKQRDLAKNVHSNIIYNDHTVEINKNLGDSEKKEALKNAFLELIQSPEFGWKE